MKEKYLDFRILAKNFLYSGVTILSIGYLSSSMPFINFMSYYYFGQTKYGTDNQNLFSVDIWEQPKLGEDYFQVLKLLVSFLH